MTEEMTAQMTKEITENNDRTNDSIKVWRNDRRDDRYEWQEDFMASIQLQTATVHSRRPCPLLLWLLPIRDGSFSGPIFATCMALIHTHPRRWIRRVGVDRSKWFCGILLILLKSLEKYVDLTEIIWNSWDAMFLIEIHWNLCKSLTFIHIHWNVLKFLQIYWSILKELNIYLNS